MSWLKPSLLNSQRGLHFLQEIQPSSFYLLRQTICYQPLNYDRYIIEVLAEAGEAGINVQKISRHVFNACNTLFNPLCFDDVHAYVLQYVQKNSRTPSSILQRLNGRGTYRLNPDSVDARQLTLQFKPQPAEETRKPAEDLSLSLF